MVLVTSNSNDGGSWAANAGSDDVMAVLPVVWWIVSYLSLHLLEINAAASLLRYRPPALTAPSTPETFATFSGDPWLRHYDSVGDRFATPSTRAPPTFLVFNGALRSGTPAFPPGGCATLERWW